MGIKLKKDDKDDVNDKLLDTFLSLFSRSRHSPLEYSPHVNRLYDPVRSFGDLQTGNIYTKYCSD